MLQFTVMTKKKKRSTKQTSNARQILASQSRSPFSPALKVTLAFIVPVVMSVLLGALAGNFSGLGQAQNNAPLLGGIGIVSWLFSLSWYGLAEVGLRGRRPLFAGIGFATLGWVTFLLLRGLLLPVNIDPAGSTRTFIYILLFEAFAAQLWAFGLIFRTVAEWRGPLTAAFSSGVLFGGIAYTMFLEAYEPSLWSLLYFIVWGIFYGIIRLRTGSLIGTAVIQTLQTFTAWVALGPFTETAEPNRLLLVYALTGLAYALFIWRLWPKTEADYRV